jgi:hypothetical protein
MLTDKLENQLIEEEKLKNLKKRFEKLNFIINRKKRSENDTLNLKIKNLQELYVEYENENQILTVEQEILAMEQNLKIAKKQNNSFTRIIENKNKIILEDFINQIDVVKSENKNMLKEFENENINNFKSFFEKLKKDEKDFLDQLNQKNKGISLYIDNLQEKIENEINERQNNSEVIENKIISELDKIEDEFFLNKRIAEETNTQLEKFLFDLQLDLENKINFEKNERIKSNNSLLELLEDSCSKIESVFSSF